MVKRNAVVFGGSGFIGSHLLEFLAGDETYERLYSVDISRPRWEVGRVTYLHHDVRDEIPLDLFGATLRQSPIDLFNLAAVHTTPGHQDWEYHWTNVLGAARVCRFATEVEAGRIWFTSSISVYGGTEEPLHEESKLAPSSAYGRSKFEAEAIHKLWQGEKMDRKLVVVRPAVIYGLGEHGNFTRLARMISKGRFFFPGRQDTIKSCGYVKDLIRSFFFVDQFNSGAFTYNFCYPERYTIREVCEAFAEVGGYRAPSLVVPSSALLGAAMGFEMLEAIGFRTGINRPRVRKLMESTNIVPRKLQDTGFRYQFDLVSSLRDWNGDSIDRFKQPFA